VDPNPILKQNALPPPRDYHPVHYLPDRHLIFKKSCFLDPHRSRSSSDSKDKTVDPTPILKQKKEKIVLFFRITVHSGFRGDFGQFFDKI
jgi:hypothetical protein